MRADLILNDVNLKKYETDPILKECRILGSSFDYSARKLFLYLDGLNIEFRLLKSNMVIALTQMDFFKLTDFVALLRLRTEEIKDHVWYSTYVRSEYLSNLTELFNFTEYDVQPFRVHLFETANATTEMSNILKVLSATNKNCFINNYDNIIEMEPSIARNFIEVLAHWIEDFEYYTERMIT